MKPKWQRFIQQCENNHLIKVLTVLIALFAMRLQQM